MSNFDEKIRGPSEALIALVQGVRPFYQQATESQVWSGLRVEYGPLPKLNTRLFQNWDKWVQLSHRLNMTCCYLDWCALELSALTGL